MLKLICGHSEIASKVEFKALLKGNRADLSSPLSGLQVAKPRQRLAGGDELARTPGDVPTNHGATTVATQTYKVVSPLPRLQSLFASVSGGSSQARHPRLTAAVASPLEDR